MGGIIIVLALSIPFLILSDYDWRAVGVFGVAIACALLGFADDYTKIVKRRSLGLRARTKLGVTIAISLALWWVATKKAGVPDTLRLRTVDATIDLGLLYPVLIYLVVAGTTSAVNLTDGLDGLAAGCVAIVGLAYIGITFITSGETDLALFAGCLVGACVGFLWFNAFPATIFMGDTGSLGLGGALAGLAVMTKTEELLIVLGGIFVVEARERPAAGLQLPGLPQARLPHGARSTTTSRSSAGRRRRSSCASGSSPPCARRSASRCTSSPSRERRAPGRRDGAAGVAARPVARRRPRAVRRGGGPRAARPRRGGRRRRRRPRRRRGRGRRSGPSGSRSTRRPTASASSGACAPSCKSPGVPREAPVVAGRAGARAPGAGRARARLAPAAERVRRGHRDERQDDDDRAARRICTARPGSPVAVAGNVGTARHLAGRRAGPGARPSCCEASSLPARGHAGLRAGGARCC